MFLGSYELDKKEYCYIYKNDVNGWNKFFGDTFTPLTKNKQTLVLQVKGKTYTEKKAWLEDLAKEYQLYFSCLSWSYGELVTIQDFFYTNAKRYGLIKEFKENAIC